VDHISAALGGRDSALLDRCDGADLLVLSADAGRETVLEHARIPVLLARTSPAGTELMDRILIAVDDMTQPDRAAELAGLLAARHDGAVAILPVPERNPALRRATAAARRSVFHAGAAIPRVIAEPAPRDEAICSVAATIDASLLVLPVGTSEVARRNAALVARSVSCSVLAVPVAAAVPRPRVPVSAANGSGDDGRRLLDAARQQCLAGDDEPLDGHETPLPPPTPAVIVEVCSGRDGRPAS
jgi:nucleotide-binding universal stress UspA family protein